MTLLQATALLDYIIILLHSKTQQHTVMIWQNVISITFSDDVKMLRELEPAQSLKLPRSKQLLTYLKHSTHDRFILHHCKLSEGSEEESENKENEENEGAKM